MAKKTTFPKQLFVKTEETDDETFFVAHESAEFLVEMGDSIKVATYQLVEVQTAEGVAQFKKARR